MIFGDKSSRESKNIFMPELYFNKGNRDNNKIISSVHHLLFNKATFDS